MDVLFGTEHGSAVVECGDARHTWLNEMASLMCNGCHLLSTYCVPVLLETLHIYLYFLIPTSFLIGYFLFHFSNEKTEGHELAKLPHQPG